ncbi:MAG TPA: NUDIX hydrolase [Planktothrix sp.]
MPKPRFKRKPTQTIPTTRVSVVVIDDDKILLVRHRKGTRRYWVLPGGRLEYGETFHECAVRELKEETGLDVEVERFLFLSEAIAPDRSRHIVNVYLKAKVVGGTMKVGNEPVLAGVDFVPLSELRSVTLFPPIGDIILNASPAGFKSGIEYLGNLWV